MAAYAATVTLGNACGRGRIPLRGTGVAMIGGTVDVTNYNSTLAEITGITKHFRRTDFVVVGPTDNGYLLRWDATSKAFKAFKATGDSGAMAECGDNVDVGAAEFVAFGLEG